MTVSAPASLLPALYERVRPYIPFAVTLGLFVAGAFALYHLLKPVSIDELMREIGKTPRRNLFLALLATVGGYMALVCYDWTALRYIRRKLPAQTIALGGFLGYAIGNTVGLSAISGGAVRYRVYSALGLRMSDIARISVFVSVASGVGATMIGLAALVFYPDALKAIWPLSPGATRAIALAGFIGANALILWISFSRARLRIGKFRLSAPRPDILVSQMVITLIDMTLGALVLFLLVPTGDMQFLPFLAVYLAAMMAGILSHVPGGVGVFETVMIAALPSTVPVADVAAGLLLYRLIYYILPFLVALIIMALAELRSLALGGVRSPLWAVMSGLIPLGTGVMVMAAGALMLLAPLIPSTLPIADEAREAQSFLFDETGALLSSALGAALVLVALALFRRLSGAWWITQIVLAVGIVASLMDHWDSARAGLLALAFLIMLPLRGEFYRKTQLTGAPLSAGWVLLVGMMTLTVIWVLFFATKATPFEHEQWWEFAAETRAPRALRVAFTGGVVLGLVTLWAALRPVRVTPIKAEADALAHAAAIVTRFGQTPDRLAAAEGHSIFFSDAGNAFLIYEPFGEYWIALGDPEGDPAEIPGLLWEFRDSVRTMRKVPVFSGVSPRWLAQWAEMGMRVDYPDGRPAMGQLPDMIEQVPAVDEARRYLVAPRLTNPNLVAEAVAKLAAARLAAL